MNSKPPIWADDAGNCHIAPNLHDLPQGLQAGIKRMVTTMVISTAALRTGKTLTHQQRGTLHAQATEAMDIMLSVLLTRLPNDQIDRHPYSEKRHFAAGWLNQQTNRFGVSV